HCFLLCTTFHSSACSPLFVSFLFFMPAPPPSIYTLSLHDALPISGRAQIEHIGLRAHARDCSGPPAAMRPDRTPSQVLIEVRIDERIRISLRSKQSFGPGAERVVEYNQRRY